MTPNVLPSVDMGDIIRSLADLAGTVLFVAVILFIVWRWYRWVHDNISGPLAARTVSFMDQIQQSMDLQGRVLNVVADTVAPLGKAFERQEQQMTDLKHMIALLERDLQLQETVASDLVKVRDQLREIEDICMRAITAELDKGDKDVKTLPGMSGDARSDS